MRRCVEFFIENPELFAENLVFYITECNNGVMLRGGSNYCNGESCPSSKFGLIASVGEINSIKLNTASFDALEVLLKQTKDWLLGYFSYDLKNELEDLHSANIDGLGFPDLFFFQPELLLTIEFNKLSVHYFESITSTDKIDWLIRNLCSNRASSEIKPNGISFKSRYSRQEYLNTIMQVKRHIARGDIYEMNLCQEFYAENCEINPASTFNDLYKTSPTPFAAFVKVGYRYLMSASPERYIKKDGNLIVSQPIKGTAPRGLNPEEDEKSKRLLANDPKERAENIMIVDLVRNDLSKVASCGSVRVTELCGIYSFPQVHQMVSTVTCRLQPNLSPVDPIKATFPMGSMTGAPKVRAMQLIEEFERTKRGLFSGAVGYFSPDGDFDFNVVIRSLLYNQKSKYLSFTVGGAITFSSDPEKEYAECLLKAKAILTTLNATINNAG